MRGNGIVALLLLAALAAVAYVIYQKKFSAQAQINSLADKITNAALNADSLSFRQAADIPGTRTVANPDPGTIAPQPLGTTVGDAQIQDELRYLDSLHL